MYFINKKDACAVASHKIEAIHELHDHLMVLEGKLPTMAVMAQQTGLSQGELNKVFTEEYGMPVHRFVQQQRMTEAHEAVAFSKVPLKVLAHRLGYSHVNHFITAFKRQFGYPPGSLRK